MKKITITLLILIGQFLCFSQSRYKEEFYQNPLLIDSSNANKIKSFENTPESIITFFYASKIRNDEKWKEVVLPQHRQSNRLKSKLKKYKTWRFHKFKLVSKKKYSKFGRWIKIFMEIEFKGEKVGGRDSVTVELIDGKWIITSVPT